MPSSQYFGTPLATAVTNGQVPQSRLDDMVRRMLVPMFAYGLMNASYVGRNTSATPNNAASDALARSLASKSITLLQNKGGLLPIAAAAVRTIAVIGDENTVAGGGSGGVNRPCALGSG